MMSHRGQVSIAVLTYIPSPYQVELFDAVSEAVGGQLRVLYRLRSSPDRQWNAPLIGHAHCFLEDGADELANTWIGNADLVVFGSYQGRSVRRLITARIRSGRPWAFWGERPGVHWKGYFGRLLRRITQHNLHASRAPVWGIGQWAVEGYRAELGDQRSYFNVPYYSNLQPYLAIDRSGTSRDCRTTFLFSGSLIKRKGVDLLAGAFKRLVADGGDARLAILGAGPLEADLRKSLNPLRDRVKLIGFRQWAELPQVYAEANILCAPSRYDGWGLVIAEGLAAGMPVISTTSTGAARELVSPKTGWLIEPEDEDGLLRALQTAVSLDQGKLHQFSLDAREVGRSQTVEAGVQRFLSAAYLTIQDWGR